jgi:hypothetical protein
VSLQFLYRRLQRSSALDYLSRCRRLRRCRSQGPLYPLTLHAGTAADVMQKPFEVLMWNLRP